MARLTDKEHWDSKYRPDNSKRIKGLPKNDFGIRHMVKKCLGEHINYIRINYSDYFLWEVLCKKYLPKRKGAKVLEIGSAPGRNLIKLKQIFSYVPYGIEYSYEGVQLNRKIFTENKIDPDNVIYSDFFDEYFQKKYEKYFDMVLSLGFVEHFDNVNEIIQKHVSLLKSGGYLIVSIPNFRGINYLLLNIFCRELISKHNMDIMQLQSFSKLFDREDLTVLFCGYYGIFNFGLFSTKAHSPLRFLLGFFHKLQLLLNLIFHISFKDRPIANRLFSPYLIFIGIKKHMC